MLPASSGNELAAVNKFDIIVHSRIFTPNILLRGLKKEIASDIIVSEMTNKIKYLIRDLEKIVFYF